MYFTYNAHHVSLACCGRQQQRQTRNILLPSPLPREGSASFSLSMLCFFCNVEILIIIRRSGSEARGDGEFDTDGGGGRRDSSVALSNLLNPTYTE